MEMVSKICIAEITSDDLITPHSICFVYSHWTLFKCVNKYSVDLFFELLVYHRFHSVQVTSHNTIGVQRVNIGCTLTMTTEPRTTHMIV